VRPFLVLVRLRLDAVRGDPKVAFVHFGLPLLLMLVTGMLFLKGHPFERRTLTIVTAPGEPGRESIAARLARFPDVRVASDASEDVARRKLATRIVSAILVLGPAGPALSVSSTDELFGRAIHALLPGPVSFTVVPVASSAYFGFLFPGLISWTIMIQGLYGMGYSLASYRRSRFLRKLSTTPLSKVSFVAAQIGSRTILAFGQTALMVLAAHLVLGLDLQPAAWPWLGLLIFAGLLVFMGVGFALASFIRNELNMQDTINAAGVVLVLVSDIFFPADELPDWLVGVAGALPSTQLVRLFRAVMLHGETAAAGLWPGLAMLAAWAIAAYAVSLAVFRWTD
jgi:ABC-2 type transport system permease protein